MSRILIITEKFHLPVNDGISIAVTSLCALLRKHEISFYVYPSCEFYQEKSSSAVLLNIEEIPFYDLIITSPLHPSLFFVNNRKKFKFNKSIAFLSDCYTYALYRQIALSLKFGFSSVKYISINGLKMIRAYQVERRIARNMDLLLFQTNRDVEVFKKFVVKANAMNVPNVPDRVVMIDNESRDLNAVAFVASFVGSYMKIADWFFEKVWLQVIKKNDKARIHLLGKGNSTYAAFLVDRYPSLKETIIIERYIEDIDTFFQKKHLSVAPVFKGYGLINKTVESMMNGCLTIGDAAAYNGLEGVIHGKNCFIADDASSFINIIIQNLGKDNDAMRRNANKLISEELDAKKYAVKLNSKIEELLNASGDIRN